MNQILMVRTTFSKNVKGNIFAMLFAAVAMTGVLGVVGMQTMSGPVRTITKVTQKNITDTDLLTNARIVIMHASTLPSNGDADSDGYIEPVGFDATCTNKPTGGGCLPSTIGAIQTDPWGTNYGYCVWDQGSTNSSANRIDGEDNTSGVVLAIISAGPNKVFDTSCNAYDGAAGVDAVDTILSPDADGAVDDTVRRYTYEAALAGSGGLWSEAGNDAYIANPNVTDEVIIGGGATIDIGGLNTGTAGTGTFPAVRTDFLNSMTAGNPVELLTGLRLDSTYATCNAGNSGVLRYNAGNVEYCNGTLFVGLAAAGEPWRVTDGDNGTFVSAETTSGGNDDTITMATAGSTRLTISSTGVVDITGDTDIGGTLDVTGGATVGANLSVTGDLTVTGDDITMGTNTLGAILVADGTNFNPVVMSGDASVAADGTLSVGADVLDFDNFTDTMELDASTSITADGTEVLSINNTGTGDSFVVDDGTNQFVIDADGNVSIGNGLSVASNTTLTGNLTVNGATTLGNASGDLIDINGTLKIGAGDSCAGGGDAGKLQYSGGTLYFCNGSSWQSASAPSKLTDIGNVNNGIEIAGNDGYVLVWDDGTSEWIAANPSGLTAGTSNDSRKLVDEDGDTQIQVEETSDEDIIRFDTEGDERMVILGDAGNGFVGIGKTDPGSLLTLLGGDLSVRETDDGNDAVLLSSDASTGSITLLSGGSTNTLISSDSSTDSYFNAGDVIIGGTSADASAKFQIDATAQGFLMPRNADPSTNITSPATGVIAYNSTNNTFDYYDGTTWQTIATADGASATELIDGTANDDDTWIRVAADDGSDNDTIRFAAGDGTEHMRITSAGNVGIATTSPSSPLHVAGNIRSDNSLILGLTAGDAPTYITPTVTASDITVNSIDWLHLSDAMTLDATTTVDMDTNTADLNFDGGTFFIDDDGQIGIGTESPDASAILDIDATDKGVLIPRMTTAERDSIASPAASLMVFNTTDNEYQYNAGTSGTPNWQPISGASCGDTTPDAFDFSNLTNQATTTVITSNIEQISGLACAVTASITGDGTPQLRTCSDATCTTVVQDWTSSAQIADSEYLQIRLTSSAIAGGTSSATVSVGSASDYWQVTTSGGDCTVADPIPGTVCADGTVYAGKSPDGNVKMYTSRCDEGESWSGAACTGSRVSLPWNNGNGSGYVDTSTTNSFSGAANTDTLNGLDSDSVTSGTQLHQAAQRCANFGDSAEADAGGHTDWYLPAEQELDVLYLNNGAIGNFNMGGGKYWSSTGVTDRAFGRRFSDGFQLIDNKSNAYLVRCVRREGYSPSGPSGGNDGEVMFNNSGALDGDANFVWDYTNGILGLGTGTPNQYSILDITSTDKGALLPRMTQAERDAMDDSYGATEEGMVIYVTDTDTFDYWDGSAWTSFATSSGSSTELIDGTTNDDDTWVRVAADDGSDNDTIRFAAGAGTEHMRITSAGNVGIGTTTPASALDVTGDVGVSNYVKLGAVAGDAPTYVPVGASNITDGSIDWNKIVDAMTLDATTTVDMDTNTADLNFDGGTFFIDDDGQIGIGTATPNQYALVDMTSTTMGALLPRMTQAERDAMDDSYGATEEGMVIYVTDTDTFDYWDGSAWTSFATSSGSSTELIDGTTNDDDTWVRVAADDGSDNDTIRFAAGAGTEHMRITSAGNVGIGTTTPASALDVTGDVGVSNHLKFAGVAGNTPTYVSLSASNITDGSIDWSKMVDAMTLDATTSINMDTNSADLNFDSDTFVIDSSADMIGIGTATPAVELDVVGDIQYTGTLTDISDRRLKTDITALNTDEIVKRLTAIDTYTFHMKDNPEGTLEYGVMAQELEKLFPELVRTAEDEMGTKSVNYIGLIAPMIETTKALKAENDALKSELADVKAKQDAMLSDIEALKAHTGVGVSGADMRYLLLVLVMIAGGWFGYRIINRQSSQKS